MKTGLIGAKLTHSFSPRIHQALGDNTYTLYEVPQDQLALFLTTTEASGLNVTIPYKETVIPFLASITSQAKRIGSVNTIWKDQSGNWHGDNTDYFGFKTLIENAPFSVYGKRCLILGAGGTAKTVRTVLEDLGALEIRTMTRQGPLTFEDLPSQTDIQILINTTPVGMYPNCPSQIVNLKPLISLKAVFDVIYNPLQTKLIFDAREQGYYADSGLTMLVAQAMAAHERFFPNEQTIASCEDIVFKLTREIKNIVLIGMPGVGKSTIGQHIATRLNRSFIDLDEVFAKQWGPPGDYILTHGEDAFRTLETDLAYTYGKEHSLVISCGGGIVTRPENELALRQNGLIFHLYRPLEELATEGRPLSKSGLALENLWKLRQPLYDQFADVTIANNNLLTSVQKITDHFQS